MKRFGQRNLGFTIVELLIVILVIGILSTIVVVAYNGTQQRGRDAETASQVKQYLDALKAYYSYNGSYPATVNTCLGTGYTNGRCWQDSAYESTSFMAALKPYGDNLPKLKQGVVYTGGIFVAASNGTQLDGVNRDFLAYTIGKSGKCPIGPLVSATGWQQFSSTPPASGQSVAPNSDGDTQCWIVLDK